MEATERQIRLTAQLDSASKAYYIDNEPTMTDTDFDLKLKELQLLEKESGIVLPNSPTQRVGSDIQTEFGKVRHISPMLTIENSYDDSGVMEWMKSMREKYGADKFEISTKYDGVSLELVYKGGILTEASTRGDKLVGDDVTANAKTIWSIPLSIPSEEGWTTCVRGEVLMPRSVLKSLNESLIAEGKKPKANCRNAASGSLKQLNPAVTAERKLAFRPWDVLRWNADGKFVPYEEITTRFFRDMGFVTEEFAEIRIAGYESVMDAVREYKERLDVNSPDFDYDGVVIKVASQKIREAVGTRDHRAIEWGIARKWNEDRTGLTVLKSVTWQVGRTGALTPVANMKPIYLDGVIVSNATLHNAEFIRKNSLKINSPIKITRSGGVIPYVMGAVGWDEYTAITGEEREGEPAEITIPNTCPCCGKPLEFKGDVLKCVNPSCPEQVIRGIENWCSKDVMNLDGMGPEVIRDLVTKGIIVNALDLYLMGRNYTPSQLREELGEGYGITSVKNILASINESRKRPFECVICGFGIDGIGKQNAKLLARHFRTMENLVNAGETELAALPGIGAVLAKNISSFMERNGKEWLWLMNDFGLSTEYAEKEVPGTAGEKVLAGLSVVFSGKSENFPGDAIEEYLESLGAKCGHSVTKKLDYLITGEKPGPSKVQKAHELNIKTLSEEEFFRKFNLSPRS